LDTKANYMVVGLFVILLGAALVFGVFWMSATHNAKNYNFYLVYTNEAVSGLNVHAPVKFNGVKVGYVKSIKLNLDDIKQVKLLLAIEESVPITTSTVATLKAQGITGITYLGLKAETAKAPLLKAKPSQEYPVIPSQPSLFIQLGDVLRKITNNVDQLTQSFKLIFDQENAETLTRSLKNIEHITTTIVKNDKAIDESIKSANVLLKKSSEKLPPVLDKLSDTLTMLYATSKSVKQDADASRVLIQNFTTQELPSSLTLIDRLSNLTLTIQAVAEKLQLNPSMLVRGELPPPPGPGER